MENLMSDYIKPLVVGLVALALIAFFTWLSPFLVFGAFALTFAGVFTWLLGNIIMMVTENIDEGKSK
jgi:sorbitol-specific phosphotransferase system component IIBC